jgi:hypothetical protein
LAAVMWLLLLGGGSALATTGHDFAGQFGGPGSGDGQFGEGPSGLAVMPPTGDIFTLDASGSVQRFNAAGVFQSKFVIDPLYAIVSVIAVDPAGAGAVYLEVFRNDGVPAAVKYSADGNVAYELNASGSGTSIGFNQPSAGVTGNAGLAVDQANGAVYAVATNDPGVNSSLGPQVIDSFDPATGAFVAAFDGSNNSPDGGFACPSGLAVDGTHHIYVLDACKGSLGLDGLPQGRVDKYDAATGAWQSTVDDGSRGMLSTVAADPATDEVYVSEAGPVGAQVTHFSAGGTDLVYTFDASNVDGVRAMTVGGAGTVYTSDATNPFVERFTRFDGPTVTTIATPPVINPGDATLSGTINPESVASTYHFEYGLGPTYGSRVPLTDADAGSGNTPVTETADINGLAPNTLYHYRIVGSNASGSIAGADATFTTGTIPPTPDGSPAFASAITPRGATLHGTINPNNSGACWHFEFGVSTAYGSSPSGSCFFAPGVGTDQRVATLLSNLEPNTLYHFRVVAQNFLGDPPQYGADQTFFTSPEAGGGARDVTTRRATLTGTINPHGAATTYHFNYGPTTSYGASTPEADGGDADGGQAVAQQISGLSPDTTYHVQVVATTDGVVHSGTDGLFRTAPAPTAEAIGPSGVTTNAATLAGELSTYGLTGTYHFDVWSLDSSYAISTGERPVAGNTSTERVSAALSGLPAGERFAVQLTVSSNDSIKVSDLLTFATADIPKVFPQPPGGDTISNYGCASPRLDAYNARPKPGDTIKITGSDLGIGANVTLGDRSLTASDWSSTGFRLTVPDDAEGTLALTIDCGHRSNTIGVAVFQQPDNTFSVTRRSVTGSAATVTVRLPGPGKVETSANGAKAPKVTVKKAGTATIKVKLTSTGLKALRKAKSRTLKVSARVRFTPAGGQPNTKTVTLTFKRKAGR